MRLELLTSRQQREELLKELQEEASRREIEGLSSYGAFNPLDYRGRNMSREGQLEQCDSFNYMRFLRRKHPELKELVAEVQKYSFKAYALLRILQRREEELDEQKRKEGE